MNKHGQKWIRNEKRLAIYIRDGLSCVYCGDGVETSTKLTLDHLDTRCSGGSNDASNLVTCCFKCNTARGTRSVKDFVGGVASYILESGSDILNNIERLRQKPLNVNAAKGLIEDRGGFRAAVYSNTESEVER